MDSSLITSPPAKARHGELSFPGFILLRVVQACDVLYDSIIQGCASAFSQNNVNLRLKVNFLAKLSPNTGSF